MKTLSTKLTEPTLEEVKRFLTGFREQEMTFKTWLMWYYEAAFYLDAIARKVGRDNLEGWLAVNCSEVSFEICEDMLHKLHHTPTGRAVLAANHPDKPFKFPPL